MSTEIATHDCAYCGETEPAEQLERLTVFAEHDAKAGDTFWVDGGNGLPVGDWICGGCVDLLERATVETGMIYIDLDGEVFHVDGETCLFCREMKPRETSMRYIVGGEWGNVYGALERVEVENLGTPNPPEGRVCSECYQERFAPSKVGKVVDTLRGNPFLQASVVGASFFLLLTIYNIVFLLL